MRPERRQACDGGGSANCLAQHPGNAGENGWRDANSIEKNARFVIRRSPKTDPKLIEEGTRVGLDRSKFETKLPLPPKNDPSLSMVLVEEKPEVTYKAVD